MRHHRRSVTWPKAHHAFWAVSAVALVCLGSAAPALAAPATATTKPATTLHHTSAVLNGELDPGTDAGGVVDCHFEWGTTISYGNMAPCNEGNSFASPAAVTANLGFLTPNTTYHFRLDVTTVPSGLVSGADQSFLTPAFPALHDELGSFGQDGTSASSFDGFGPFTLVSALAINQANRKLYAVASDACCSSFGIYGFDASAPLAFPPLGGFTPLAVGTGKRGGELAVDSNTGNIYAVSEDSHLVYGFDSSGTPLGGNFPIDPGVNPGGAVGSAAGGPTGIAVDAAGDIWVANATAYILNYSSAGVFKTSVDVSAEMPPDHFGPSGVAVDSNGNLYVGASSPDQGTWRYTAASGYTDATKIDPNGALSLAVDPSTDNLYVAFRTNVLERATGVSEYDAAGNPLGDFATGLVINNFGGIAVDATNHYVYVSDGDHHKIRVFGPDIPQELPTVTPGAPSGISGTTAVLHAKVDPEGNAVTDCRFEYGTTKSYGQSAPCAPAPGAGSGDVAVSASLSLEAGRVYHFRIVAANATGASKGPDQTLTTPGPQFGSASVAGVGETSATLTAQVNPLGKATSYHFEYGTSTAYGSIFPVPDADAGAVNANRPTCTVQEENDGCIPYAVVAQGVKGLAPGTTYHFRIVATNSDATSHSDDATFTTYDVPPSFGACPNDAFRAGKPSAKLPDCRAYEQATPIDKNGNSVGGKLFAVQASPAGDGITSLTKAGIPGGEGAQVYPIFLSQRGPSGWSTQGLMPPPVWGDDVELLGYTRDLAYAFATAAFAGSDSVGGLDRAFLMRSSATHEVQQITPYLDKALYGLAGTSADNSKVFFEVSGFSGKLTADAAKGKSNLYLYEPASEELSLVGLLPTAQGGKAPAGGSRAGGGSDSRRVFTEKQHAISTDGDKAFFTADDSGQIYLREGLNGKPKTVQVSSSQRAVPDPGGAKPAEFISATPDGSKAFFTSCEKLTEDSTAHSTPANTCETSSQGNDLYLYDTSSRQLSDLTVDAGDPGGAEVMGVVGTSNDGSYVYFVANGDLDEGGPAGVGDCKDLAGSDALEYAGSCSLYVWHAGAAKFVATLNASNFIDTANWLAEGVSLEKHANTGRVSADGQTVVFMSSRQQTGYDITKAGNSEVCPETCSQIYRYHLGDPAPTCVSCNPTGALATVRPTIWTIDVGLSQFINYPNLAHFVSASGDRVFFETLEKLVGADVNGRLDVYEWEAPEAGSCREASSAYSAQDKGCLYLLSPGTGITDAHLADASASGNDVFIYSDARLVPGDEDELVDIYDVSVGGGLAAQNQPPPAPDCEGAGCREGGSVPPAGPSAGSASFAGPADPSVKRCPKGKVRKRGKCMKPHKKHHKHHKRQAGQRAGAKQGGRK